MRNSVSLKPRLWCLLSAVPTGSRPKADVLEADGDYVVLLHGLGRCRSAMRPLATHLHDAGYHTINIGYPSRRETLETITSEFIAPVIAEKCPDRGRRIHFVGHSMGCIIIRALLKELEPCDSIGRTVMLAPPNNGSEIIDRMGNYRWFQKLMGPASLQLSTDESGVPRSLGRLTFDAGVIMGNRGYFPWFSSMLPGQNDGIVSVEGGRLPGMNDFTVLRASHSFIMCKTEVMKLTAHYLAEGKFAGRQVEQVQDAPA